MKKYKLIKEYPGSLKLETVVQYYKNWNMYGMDQQCLHNKEVVENFPEFWEEIINIGYEVLSIIDKLTDEVSKVKDFQLTSGAFIEIENGKGFTVKDNTKCIFKNFNIYSFRRLSDNQIFSIGDKLFSNEFKSHGEFILKEIEFEIDPIDKGTGKLSFIHDHKILGKWLDLEDLQKVEKLFTTEDGIDIYKGDTYWFLRKNYEPFIPTIDVAKDINPNFPQIQKHLGFITFSTREKAEEYVYFNKPRFSFKDIEKAITQSEIIGKEFITNCICTSLEKYCL